MRFHRNCSPPGITHLACPQNQPNPYRWLRSSRFGSDAVPSELLWIRITHLACPQNRPNPNRWLRSSRFWVRCRAIGIALDQNADHLACHENRPNPNRWLRSSRFCVRCRAIGIALDPESLTSPARKISGILIGGFVRRVFGSRPVPSACPKLNHVPRLAAKSAKPLSVASFVAFRVRVACWHRHHDNPPTNDTEQQTTDNRPLTTDNAHPIHHSLL